MASSCSGDPRSTTTLTTSSLFLSSFSTSASSSTPPLSLSLLAQNSPLPPVPPDFPDPNLIPHSRFVVDGFRLAGDFSVSYFLSHFHSDHYSGLSPSWCRGIIFCSEITAQLLIEILKVPSCFVYPLSLETTFQIDGWDLILIEANHCPGAVQFLFKNNNSSKVERYIHTGDFRFSPSMKENQHLVQFKGLDAIFLDTTYCNPKFNFGSQEDSIDYIVKTIQRVRNEEKSSENKSDKTLFLVATYVIGKEKILLEIARNCNCKLYVDSKKMEILSILGFGDYFTENFEETDVYTVNWNVLGETWPFFKPNFANMREIMDQNGKFTRGLGFVATGWMHESEKKGFSIRVKDCFEIHLVSYSEHSNFEELKEFVRFLKPKKIIPTVGNDIKKCDNKGSVNIVKYFSGLMDEMANKHEFLSAFKNQKLGIGFGDEDQEVEELGFGDEKKELGNLGFDNEKELEEVEELELGFCDKKELEGKLGLGFGDEKEMEEKVKELRDLVPNWVTNEQISSLLEISNGDVIQAVSEFLERERDFFEEANILNNNDNNSSDILKSEANEIKPMDLDKIIPPVIKPLVLNSHLKTPNPKKPINPKKRVSSSSPSSSKSKTPKKKANPTKSKFQSTVQSNSTGGVQSTITSFFSRNKPNTNISSSEKSSEINEESKLNQNLDQFIQIIGGELIEDREMAESLLEKAKGDINLAVELFYDNEKNEKEVSKKGKFSMVSCGSSNTNKSNENDDVASVALPIEKYEPIEHACWKAGEPAPYLHLARTYNQVEKEKGKIKICSMFCNMFRSLLALSPEDVLPAVYLCTNRIAPDHQNMELNIGANLVVAALEESLGTSKDRIRNMYNAFGDLGDVAQECRQSQSLLASPRPLSIRGVFNMLRKISGITGGGSASRRRIHVMSLLNSCREMEMKYIVRTLIRNLRIGAMMKTILASLSNAVVLNGLNSGGKLTTNQEEQMKIVAEEVTKAYNVLPNLDLLIPSLLSQGCAFSSSNLEIIPGMPIPPMLARITNGFAQALKLFEGKAFTCEYKYDGQRAQIHKLQDDSIKIFSRQMKESTFRFPDLVNVIKESCDPKIQSFILDTEVVAIDRKNKKIMSFQELSSRERGSKDASVLLHNIKVDVCVFVFDIMFHDGQRLLEFPLRERRKYLRDLIQEKPGYFELATEITVEESEAFLDNECTINKMKSFFEKAFECSCEGIMIKTLDFNANYSASNRSESWLKVKRDYIEGLGDSLDLIPIGAWHGNGRKAGWYSPFLMACYNPDSEEYQSVCRVMSGFSDSFYKQMKEYFSDERILSKKPVYYKTDESPDFWFVPDLVWEIRGADLTISPVHHAAIGLVHASKGISVRLPRFIRFLSDRNTEDCSTSNDIASLFRSQTRKMDVDNNRE
ncbi:hypothetical protein LUZ60_008074 [Juncus effusus]|nr:hypothetical protein LUZ60_008074 [Juncus effusus]